VNINEQTSIFILGGEGAVGYLIAEIARIRGAKKIITSAANDEEVGMMKQLHNSNDVIKYATENVIQRVLELTNGQGVDIACDTTYLTSNFEKSIQSIKEGGTCIVFGALTHEGALAAKKLAENKSKLAAANIARYWSGAETRELKTFAQRSLAQGAEWIQQGKLKPYISTTVER
jgi:NADPH2:quinone reductase